MDNINGDAMWKSKKEILEDIRIKYYLECKCKCRVIITPSLSIRGIRRSFRYYHYETTSYGTWTSRRTCDAHKCENPIPYKIIKGQLKCMFCGVFKPKEELKLINTKEYMYICKKCGKHEWAKKVLI